MMFATAEYRAGGIVGPARCQGEGSTHLAEGERVKRLVREKIEPKPVADGDVTDAYAFAR